MSNLYSRRPSAASQPLGCVGIILFAIVAVLGIGGDVVLSHMNNSVQTITVTSKDDQIVNTGTYKHPSIGHQYLIFTRQGVFKDTDNIWLWKWNSSDLFGQLLPGHTYRCKVHGVRNRFTSGYPDLMSCTQVPGPR